MIRLPITKKQGYGAVPGIAGEGQASDEGYRGPRGSRKAQEQRRQGQEFGNPAVRVQRT
jgi:hypothetical protein